MKAVTRQRAVVVALAGGTAAALTLLAASPVEAQSRRERAAADRGSSSSSSSGRRSSSSEQGSMSSERRSSPFGDRRSSLPSSLGQSNSGFHSDIVRQRERNRDTYVSPRPSSSLPPKPNASSGSLGNPSQYSFDRLRGDQRPGDIMQNRTNLPRRLPHDRGRYNGGNYGGHYDHHGYDHHGYNRRGGDTVIILGGGSNNFCFNGYVSTYHPRLTVYSPFSIYSCPTYIRTDYVINTGYPYLYGRETYTFLPYADNDSYYRSNVNRGQALRAALNDLIRFWEDSNAGALRQHVSPDVSIGVFQDEKYAFSLRRADFLDLSADALERVTTLSFRFDSVRDRSDGLVNVYATHLYRVRGERQTRSANVRYTLIYLNGQWLVSAISHTADINR